MSLDRFFFVRVFDFGVGSVTDFTFQSLKKNLDCILFCPTKIYVIEGLVHYFL